MLSPKAAGLAVKMGYTEVYAFREGIPGWIKAGYPTASKTRYPDVDIPLISPETLNGMSRGSVFVVDIRPKSEFSKGHVKGAQNFDVEKLPSRIGELPKDKKLVLVDRKGKLVKTVGRWLVSKGFTDVARLDGGFNAWRRAGLPVER